MSVMAGALCLVIGGLMGLHVPQASSEKSSFWSGKFPVMVMAHRGFSGAAPENTLSAFKKAIDIGADVIELDVRLSKDKYLVVFHDDTLERTTKRIGRVADLTLQELKGLDAGGWFGPSFAGERIPTLTEVFELARGRVLLNIELKKGDRDPYSIIELADRALDEIKKAKMEDRILFSSFDATAVARIIEKNGRIPAALISRNPWTSPFDVMEGHRFSVLNCRMDTLNPVNLKRARQEGVRIGVWTPNTEEEMDRFVSMEVDAILTNHPDRLIQLLQKKYR
jgi:glycerophosphoryl diester phosphodiesterase